MDEFSVAVPTTSALAAVHIENAVRSGLIQRGAKQTQPYLTFLWFNRKKMLTLSELRVIILFKRAKVFVIVRCSQQEMIVNFEGSVPEKDRFEMSLGAGWCASFQYVKNGRASSEEICDKLLESLAKNLRKYNGFPGFQAMVRVVALPLEHALSERFKALEEVAQYHEGHRHTKIAAEVAKTILVQLSYGGGTLQPMNLDLRFAEDSCYALIKHYFFDKVSRRLVAAGNFTNHEEFHKWQIKLEKSLQPRIEKIATQLIRNVPANKIRAPRRVVRKMSTTDLLAEDLTLTR